MTKRRCDIVTRINLDNGTDVPLTEYRKNEGDYRKAAGPNAYQYDDRNPKDRTAGLPDAPKPSPPDKPKADD